MTFLIVERNLFWGMYKTACVCACMLLLSYPAARLVVVQVHLLPPTLGRALGEALLALAGVHKLPGEPVAVVEVVPTAAPQPVTRQVFRSGGPAAAAAGELTLPASPAHCIHHPSCTDGVGESRLPAACRDTHMHRHNYTQTQK